jgi:topoisomerase-4 subunit B
VGKDKFYALDEAERAAILARIDSQKLKGKVSVQRFKGLGEMNALQLRETAMSPDTRRLVRLMVGEQAEVENMLDMLLAKKRAGDRKTWLERKGDLAELN